jgi:hypothetical protein
MKDEVTKTLQFRTEEIIKQFLNDHPVKGGVVFTHLDARYDIGPDCPVALGAIQDWMHQLADAPEIPGWNLRTTLRVLDGLLERHQKVTQSERRSMAARAKGEIQRTEAELAQWVDATLSE